MIILDVAQGTQEWFDARLGIPTASKFSEILTNIGKKPSKSVVDKYMNGLIAEELSGVSSSTFGGTNWTDRGGEIEPEARAEYEFDNDIDVQEVGLIYYDKKKEFACSPDGLVGENGGLEIKCPAPHTHIGYLLAQKLPTKYIAQVQGSMLVTGRKWWDFMSYCPLLPTLKIRVERDEEYIENLYNAIQEFVKAKEERVGCLSSLQLKPMIVN